MVEVYSYLHPGCGSKMPRCRGEDKELGKIYPLEFETRNTLIYLSYSPECFLIFIQQTFFRCPARVPFIWP